MKFYLATLCLLLLSGCSSTPVLEPYAPAGVLAGSSSSATVWADNADLSYMMIKRVDGKRTPSRKGSGLPYSVALAPGRHKLEFFVTDLSDFNPFLHGGRFADLELEVDLAADHSYALRIDSDGRRVRPYLVDLGAGKVCRYEIAGKMRQGYVPVRLVCY